jgi:hypothetical protein
MGDKRVTKRSEKMRATERAGGPYNPGEKPINSRKSIVGETLEVRS